MILNLLRAERIFVNSRIVYSTFKRVKRTIGALTENSVAKRGADNEAVICSSGGSENKD